MSTKDHLPNILLKKSVEMSKIFLSLVLVEKCISVYWMKTIQAVGNPGRTELLDSMMI